MWGVVYTKIDATLADLLLFGYAQLDITAALQAGTALQAGPYYLSRNTPGALIATLPPIAVPVLRSDGNGNVFVTPQWEDLVNNHSHLKFRLKPIPAGNHEPANSGINVITDPNPDVEGWLPANNAVFKGNAPHDAKFGYNLSANRGLNQAWPPLSPATAVLFENGLLMPQSYNQGDGGLVRFDKNGIWWMSDCVGSSPFPDKIQTNFLEVSESASISEDPADCPHYTPWRQDLFFSQVSFLTDSTVVTSLTTTDPRISIFCAGNPAVAASTGPLQLQLNLQFLFDNIDPGGFLAIKSFDPTKQLFHRGPITTGIYANSDNITLVGDNHTTVTIADTPTEVFQGNVGIDVVTAFNREIFPDLVRLGTASEQYLQTEAGDNGIPYIAFEPGVQQFFRARIPVPKSLDVANPSMQLQFRLLGVTAGTLPALTLTYQRIPADTGTPLVLPAADTSLDLVYSITTTEPNSYKDVDSVAFPIVAGDDVLFTLTRNADAYTGELGILRIAGIIADDISF